MPHHEWGDEDFDWKSLNQACNFFLKLRTIGRIQMASTKEKYGTMRLDWFFWNGHYREFLHSMIYPGHLYIHWPLWMRKIDEFATVIAKYLGILRLVSCYQRLIFNVITFIAVKKWSHIKDEIMDEYEFNELLYDYTKKKLNYVCNWK